MSLSSRRRFLLQGTAGLAAYGASTLVLHAEAEPTAASGPLGSYGKLLAREWAVTSEQLAFAPQSEPADWKPTADNILGPYHRKRAPYRAKITPPLEPGTVLVVRGRVWGHDTRKPLSGATIDIWQANAEGRYDNDDPKKPPAEDVFLNRARLVTDEKGYYEFESVHPGRYQVGENIWRPSHVHYMVAQPGYKTLVTQLYFQGDPMNKTDQFIKPSLIIDVENVRTPNGSYESGVFDIVLAKG